MRVYRLTKQKYSASLNGIGAALKGGRWNSKGTEIIYTAANRALAMVEALVHLSPQVLPESFMMMEIDIPDTIKIDEIKEILLPDNWQIFPLMPASQKVGDNFIRENNFAVLKVPSAIVKGDYNYLINPYHVDFKKIKVMSIEPFGFDKRLRGG